MLVLTPYMTRTSAVTRADDFFPIQNKRKSIWSWAVVPLRRLMDADKLCSSVASDQLTMARFPALDSTFSTGRMRGGNHVSEKFLQVGIPLIISYVFWQLVISVDFIYIAQSTNKCCLRSNKLFTEWKRARGRFVTPRWTVGQSLSPCLEAPLRLWGHLETTLLQSLCTRCIRLCGQTYMNRVLQRVPNRVVKSCPGKQSSNG